jgi:hypothetical protein
MATLTCAPPTMPPDHAGGGLRTSSGNCSILQNFGQFNPIWSCSQTLGVWAKTGVTEHVDARNAAVGIWDAQLSQFPGLPQLGLASPGDSASAEIIIVGETSGSDFCGQADPISGGRWQITLKNTACASDANRGSMTEVLVHELGHALGWTGSAADQPGGTYSLLQGKSDHCSRVLPPDPPRDIPSMLCAHEIEAMAVAYGLREWFDADHWYTRKFVTGAYPGLTPVSIDKGNTHQFSAANQYWQLEPSGQVAWPAHHGQWASSDPSVVTIGLTTGLATAVG